MDANGKTAEFKLVEICQSGIVKQVLLALCLINESYFALQPITIIDYPDSKIHGANLGPIWGRKDPGGAHVGPMNFAIWVVYHQLSECIKNPFTFVMLSHIIFIILLNHDINMCLQSYFQFHIDSHWM